MNPIFKNLSATILSLSAITTFASPEYLTTTNNTNEESNAYIAGTIPSPYPTARHTTRKIYWNLVRLACFGHTTGGKCNATIKMATNTATPKDVADVSLDLNSGVITIEKLKNPDYKVIIPNLGEAIISKK